MKYTLNGREVEIIRTKIEVSEGAYIEEAVFVDDGTELTDDQMDEMQDLYQAELYEDAYSSLVDAVHSAYEGER